MSTKRLKVTQRWFVALVALRAIATVAVLLALYRDGPELETDLPVRNDFASAAPGGGRFRCRESYDSDPLVWRRLGGSAPLGWLAGAGFGPEDVARLRSRLVPSAVPVED